MKKYIIILFVIFHFSFIKGQNLKALDDKDGFRDYKFGDTITKFTNLKLTEKSKDGKTAYYNKTDDKLKIGESDVTIDYVFYEGHFYEVFMETKGLSNSKGVLKVLNELYGNGYQDNQYIEKYLWFGSKVTLYYKENSVTNDAIISISSEPIRKKRKLDEELKIKEAKKDM